MKAKGGVWKPMKSEKNSATAIGIVETSSIAKGFEITDAVLKAADVKVVSNRTICPGKYMVLIGGSVDAVTASIETGVMVGWSRCGAERLSGAAVGR